MWWTAVTLAGTLQADVRCAASPEHRYALYLPDGWTPERRWPVLLVLDPRGQAVAALEPLIPTAERDGWVIASSYDSRSDVLGLDPTPAAARAMLLDLPRTASLAEDQVLLVGFSGTARSSWAIGEVAPQIVLGVVASGGATPDRGVPTAPPPFPWVGLAGTRDFNWQEVRRAHEAITEEEGRAWFVPFVGGHQWPPGELLDQAVRWIEVEAHARGRWPADPLPPDLVPPADFGDQGRIGEREDAFRRDLADLELWLRDPARPPPSVLRGRTILGARRVERRSAVDDPGGQAAGRMVAIARARLSFYLARDLRIAGEAERLRAALEIAATLGEPASWLLYDLACARAAVGATDDAFAALTDAVDAGFTDGAWMAEDPDLAPLRGDPRFDQILARLGQ